MSRKIDACFFCTTPYQIIAAISLVRQLGVEADLYIIDQFSDADQCGENIRKEKIFGEVRIIDERIYKHRGTGRTARWITWMKCIRAYIRINKVVPRMLIADTVYTQMFASSKCFAAELISQYFQKNGIRTETKIFDDGVGSYTRSRILSTTFRMRMTQRMTLGHADTAQAEPEFLYSPELYRKINGDPGKEIQKIYNGFQDPEALAAVNRIFQMRDVDVIHEEVILLDILKDIDLDSAGRKALDDVYQRAFSVLGRENVVIKPHPRDVEPAIEDVKYYRNHQIPFECICMNMDADRKILLSVASTAVVTPKLLLDQEPYVILLYHLVRPRTWDDAAFAQEDRFFRAFREVYDQPERMMIPASIEELEQCLDQVNVQEAIVDRT